MENSLYNLADFLDETEINSLKSTDANILKNREKIKSILKTNSSLKEQIKSVNEDLNINISIFTYRNFLIKYFKKSYEEHTLDKVFSKCKIAILDQILNNRYSDSIELYKYLFDEGLLKRVKNDENSKISYKEFIEKLKEYVDIKELSIEIKENIDDAKIVRDASYLDKNNNSTKNKIENYDIKVDIELLDGSLDSYNLRFLTYSYIFKKHSKKKFDFDEKNYIVIPPLYENKKLDFEKIKDYIVENDVINNYSLIFYDNAEEEGFLYIYRLINDKFHLLEKISSKESLDFEEYYKKGVITFLNIFENRVKGYLKS